MTTNNHTLETERRAQDARCFTYFLINAAIAFALVLVPIQASPTGGVNINVNYGSGSAAQDIINQRKF